MFCYLRNINHDTQPGFRVTTTLKVTHTTRQNSYNTHFKLLIHIQKRSLGIKKPHRGKPLYNPHITPMIHFDI